MICLRCPHCHKTLGVPDTLAGSAAACPHCQQKFRVPQPKTAEADDPAEERVRPAPRPGRAEPSGKPRRRADEEDESPGKRTRPSVHDDEDEAPGPSEETFDGLEEVTDEDEPARPARKRRRKRRRKAASPLGEMNQVLIAGLAVAAGCLVMALGSLLFPRLAIVPGTVGVLALLGGHFWVLAIAFSDEFIHGIACLVVPFYHVYYLLTHFEETKKPFFLQLFGFVIIMMTSCVGSSRTSLEMRAPRPRMQAPPSESLRFTAACWRPLSPGPAVG